VGVVSAGSYQLPSLQRGVRWLKFKGIQTVAPALAQLLLPRLLLIGTLEELRKHAILLPIPLHPRRARERGFNQSALLAEFIARDTGIPVAHLLERQRATWAQSHLPVELRADNIRNSFKLTETWSAHFQGERSLAILVDDVTTSGATLTAAASALSPIHFRQIWGLTVARG
jgi:competence protein ComFC